MFVAIGLLNCPNYKEISKQLEVKESCLDLTYIWGFICRNHFHNLEITCDTKMAACVPISI